jgi:hypothetical protein
MQQYQKYEIYFLHNLSLKFGIIFFHLNFEF